jgi:putative aminopeptidase FrvX
MIDPRHLELLTNLCNVPVAPYCEQHAIALCLDWKRQHRGVKMKRDRAGNIYLRYRNGPKVETPLVVEAHLDHPGFIVLDSSGPELRCEFRGTVRPSSFEGASAKFWVNDPTAVGSIAPVPADGRWVASKIVRVTSTGDAMEVALEKVDEHLPPGTIGMWNLPDAAVHGDLFAARVCDDLAGVAAALCMLTDLIEQKVETDVTVLLSRAEEVGFAGVIAACQANVIPRRAAIIGLETSKAYANAVQGDGPVVRVGDRAGTFSPGLTHFVSQCAGHIADEDSTFRWQRKLMDGGTCNSTAFVAFGFDATGICLPLGNYHNMTAPKDPGYQIADRAGPHIGPETINLNDFAAEVRLLVECAKRLPTYRKNFAVMRDRMLALHEKQKNLLFTTSDQETATVDVSEAAH